MSMDAETIRIVMRDGSVHPRGEVEDWDAVDIVECFDRWGRLIDRYRPSNLGGPSLRRKGDTNTEWRF